MKFKELKDASIKELELKFRQNKAEQMELKKKKSAGTLEKPHTLRLLRKDAARIMTAINMKKASEKPVVQEKTVKAPKAATAKTEKTESKPAKKVLKKESAK